jgi:hypothetical protein
MSDTTLLMGGVLQLSTSVDQSCQATSINK